MTGDGTQQLLPRDVLIFGGGYDDGAATCGGAGSDLILVGPEKLPCVPRNAASRTFWSRE